MNQRLTPAQLYAGLVGAVLAVAGIIGFFYSASFGGPGDVDDVFGILSVNAWHNLVHLGSGVVGLIAFAAGARASRTYAVAIGLVYIVVAIWGAIIGDDSILGFIPVNTEDTVLHAILGVTGVAAGLVSPEPTVAPTTA
jgi:hypothetical protein